MSLPPRSRPADEILAELDALKQHDVRWKDGRAFTLAYYAGPDVAALGDEAYRRFSSDNALNTDAFPSLRKIQSDVVAMVAALLDGGPDAAGFMTTGGTESLLMAVKAARERGRVGTGCRPAQRRAAGERPRGVREGLPLLRSREPTRRRAEPIGAPTSTRWPTRSTTTPCSWSAPHRSTRRASSTRSRRSPRWPTTAGSTATSTPAWAAWCSPTWRVSARTIPPWSFSVPGVTSISVDLHKFGYTTKGASVIVHRNRELRSHQTFVTSNWLGGTYGSSGVLGTKGGGAMAAAWAVMNHLGDDGYLRLAGQARRATLELAAAIEACPELELRAPPDAMIVAFGAADPERLDVFALADELWRRGWYVDRQQPPDSLHCTVNAVHDGLIPSFVAELHGAIDDVLATAAAGTVGSYGTVE